MKMRTLLAAQAAVMLLGAMPEVEEWQVELRKKDDDPMEVDELIVHLALRVHIGRRAMQAQAPGARGFERVVDHQRMRAGLGPVLMRVRTRISADVALGPIGRRTFAMMARQCRRVIGAFIAEQATPSREPVRVGRDPALVQVMRGLVTQMAEHGAQIVLARQFVHVLRFLRVQAQWLFAIHVFAGAQSGGDDLMMECRAHADTDGFEVGHFLEHAIDAVEGVRHVEVFRRGGCGFHARGADGGEIVNFRQCLQCRHVGAYRPAFAAVGAVAEACADNGDLDAFFAHADVCS